MSHWRVLMIVVWFVVSPSLRPAASAADIPPPTPEPDARNPDGTGYMPKAGFVDLFRTRFEETYRQRPNRGDPLNPAPLTVSGNKIQRNIPVILVDFEDQ